MDEGLMTCVIVESLMRGEYTHTFLGMGETKKEKVTNYNPPFDHRKNQGAPHDDSNSVMAKSNPVQKPEAISRDRSLPLKGEQAILHSKYGPE